MPTAGTLSELASFPDSRLRILNAENGLLIMMGSLDRVLAHYGQGRPPLAPDIVRAIVEGRQPVGLTSNYLLHHPLPDDWEKQRVLVATL